MIHLKKNKTKLLLFFEIIRGRRKDDKFLKRHEREKDEQTHQKTKSDVFCFVITICVKKKYF